mgnify:CR=1 FL=1
MLCMHKIMGLGKYSASDRRTVRTTGTKTLSYEIFDCCASRLTNGKKSQKERSIFLFSAKYVPVPKLSNDFGLSTYPLQRNYILLGQFFSCQRMNPVFFNYFFYTFHRHDITPINIKITVIEYLC